MPTPAVLQYLFIKITLFTQDKFAEMAKGWIKLQQLNFGLTFEKI